MSNSRLAHFSAGRVILLALFCTIVIGSLLLALPMARSGPMSWLDIIFTATSATCVTGLFTVPINHFSFFGHCIILFLIQIGGLGIITLTLFLLSLFVNLGLATQLMAGKLLELESWKNIRSLLSFIVLLTLCIEALGALAFLQVFSKNFAFPEAFFLAVFHAVSFFCNAGITLFGNSLQLYAHNYTAIVTATLLMFLGGLGFITLYEMLEYCRHVSTKRNYYLSLQSKIVLSGAAIGIALTALLVLLIERNHELSHLSPLEALATSIFQAVSFRSTGLLTIPISHLQFATIFLIMIICFIGSAPGSTGSGIRTTTFAIYLAVVKAAIEGHSAINIRNRRIAKDQVNKAIAIISLSIMWILITIFCLLILEPHWRFIDIVFEAVSAFTNLGLTTGITPTLSSASKVLILLSMIFGRIGSLTLILALRKIALRKESTQEISYPEERIMLN